MNESNEFNAFERERDQEMIRTEAPKESNFASAGLILTIIAICVAVVPILNLFFLWYALVPLIVGTIALVKKEPARGKAIFAVLSPVISFVITVVVTIITVLSATAIITLGTYEADRASSWKDYADVSFGNFEVTEEGYSNNTKLTVKVKNKSDEKRSFVVKVEAVDKDGDRIDTDTVYVDDLGAGKSGKYDAFTSVKEKNLDKMKDAKFKVVNVTVY